MSRIGISGFRVLNSRKATMALTLSFLLALRKRICRGRSTPVWALWEQSM